MRALSLSVALLLALSGAAVCARVNAATFKVDDSASETLQVSTAARWVNLSPRRGSNNDVEAQARVQIRLNLKPWLNRDAKIYMVSALDSTTPFLMQWTSGGVLLASRMQQGQRALVYSGRITAPQLSDVLQIALRADGRYFASPVALKFGFEIDVE